MPTACFAAALLSALSARADVDPFIGTWRLNSSASTYQSGDVPESMTIVMEATTGGVRYQSRTTQRDRRITTAQYTAAYDGRPALVIGDSGFLTPVKLERVDSRTVTASYVRAGSHVVAESRRALSADGATMTITTVFKTTNGKQVTNIGVYRRSAPDTG